MSNPGDYSEFNENDEKSYCAEPRDQGRHCMCDRAESCHGAEDQSVPPRVPTFCQAAIASQSLCETYACPYADRCSNPRYWTLPTKSDLRPMLRGFSIEG
jgi:hypothetical protein